MIASDAEQVGRSPEAEKTRARFVYEAIGRYCEQRAFGIGGFYRQESYRIDFLTIYVRARGLRLTGAQARWRFEDRQRKLKRKRLSFFDYVVSETSIREYLEANFLSRTSDPDQHKMVDDLCCWWEAWDYAFDRVPVDVRKVIPRTPQRPLSLEELEKFRQTPGVHLVRPQDRRPGPTNDPLWKNWPS